MPSPLKGQQTSSQSSLVRIDSLQNERGCWWWPVTLHRSYVNHSLNDNHWSINHQIKLSIIKWSMINHSKSIQWFNFNHSWFIHEWFNSLINQRFNPFPVNDLSEWSVTQFHSQWLSEWFTFMIHYSPLIINDQFLTQSLSLSDSVSVTYWLLRVRQSSHTHSLTQVSLTDSVWLTLWLTVTLTVSQPHWLTQTTESNHWSMILTQ